MTLGPITPNDVANAHRIGSAETSNAIVQALFAATGRDPQLFKGGIPAEDVVITPHNWAALLQTVYTNGRG